MVEEKRKIFDVGMIMFLSIIAILSLIALIKSDDVANLAECHEMCAKLNLTGITYPDAPCQYYEIECLYPSKRGTLYYKCNESHIIK